MLPDNYQLMQVHPSTCPLRWQALPALERRRRLGADPGIAAPIADDQLPGARVTSRLGLRPRRDRSWPPSRFQPQPARYATDLAGVVDAQRLAALNERLAQFEARDVRNRVLVCVDRHVAGGHHARGIRERRLQRAGRSAREGQGQRRRGVRVRRRPQGRFEVGYGLEGAIPDAAHGEDREDYLTPRFRAS